MRPGATHESFNRDEVETLSDRAFGCMFATIFVIIAIWPIFSGGRLRLWALVPAVVFLLAAVLWPRGLYALNRIWFRIGLLLHHVVTPIVMLAIFVLGVVPTALIMRMRGKDPLRVDPMRRGESNWVVRSPPGPAPDSMKRLF